LSGAASDKTSYQTFSHRVTIGSNLMPADAVALTLLILVSLFGAGTLMAVFRRMKGGFGPYNLRAVGLVLIATFAALLAVKDPSAMSAGMGILGVIAGYLFGMAGSSSE
jgi:hypothetical protein